jgi:hypothetical protein
MGQVIGSDLTLRGVTEVDYMCPRCLHVERVRVIDVREG